MRLQPIRSSVFFRFPLRRRLLPLLLWVAAGALRAEDEIVTRTQAFRGTVKEVTQAGITIVTAQGEMTLPRDSIVRATVAQPPSIAKGFEAYDKKNWKDARINLEQILRFQGLETGWAKTGMVYFGRASIFSGEFDKAAKAFSAFLALYADDPMAQQASLGMIAIEVEKQNYASALEKLQPMVEEYDQQLRPPSAQLGYAAEACLYVGRCLEGQTNAAAALDAYLKVTALYPDPLVYPEALYRAAKLYGALSQPEKALALYDELLESFPASDLARQAIADRAALKAGDAKPTTESKPAAATEPKQAPAPEKAPAAPAK